MKRDIIDSHIHLFPDGLAQRAMGAMLFDEKRRREAGSATDGTADSTKRCLQALGVMRAVVMPIATKPKQQGKINQWIQTLDRSFYLPFGAIHPRAEDALEEMARLKELHIPGIKLHPAYQQFDLREDRIFRIFEQARALGLMILLHCGNNRDHPEQIHGHPKYAMELLRALSGLTLIIAHFGCQRRWDLAFEYVIGQDVYIDISHTLSALSSDEAEKMILAHNPDKILYASDCPLQDPASAIRFLEALNIPETWKERIFCENARTLFSL